MGGETLAAARPEVDAFELAGTGMLVTDESGLILRANRAYCELLGRREDELAGQPFFHAFPKPAQSLARRALKAALEPDALPMPSHWTLVRRDGRSVAVLLTARATGGERTLAVITITDVTAMAAIEQRLTAVLDEQRLILDHAQVGILFSRSGRVMRVNAACARMFGYPERDLVGQPTTVLVAAIDGTEPPGGEPWHAELRSAAATVPPFWCEIDGQPFSAPGEPVQAIWTLRDVTGRRRAQEELARVLLDQRALLDNASVGIVFTRDRDGAPRSTARPRSSSAGSRASSSASRARLLSGRGGLRRARRRGGPGARPRRGVPDRARAAAQGRDAGSGPGSPRRR